jgi:hypothetical protein
VGRSSFTAAEIEELRRLVREKQTADRSRQKTLRARMRAIGFHISDFAADPGGFVVSDLDRLIGWGAITVIEDADPSVSPLVRGAATTSNRRSTPDARASHTEQTDDRNAERNEFVRSALRALERAEARPIAEAVERVPRRPGLYAIHAPAEVWAELGLGDPPDERPVYVGKAERSLVSRDVDTHFGNGRTGSSTVRRSFAALLRVPLGLEGRPRNPAKPERFANYGLAPEHDERLTGWMRARLALAVWPKPDKCTLALGVIEQAILELLGPPLNIKGVVTSWTTQVGAARKVMADQARSWIPSV